MADSDVTTDASSLIGICVNTASEDNATVILLMGSVKCSSFTSLTAGQIVFLSETAGDLYSGVPSSSTYLRTVGFGLDTDELLVVMSTDWFNSNGSSQVIDIHGLDIK